MKKAALLFALFTAFGSAAYAQDTAPAPAPEAKKPTTTIAEKQNSPSPMPAAAPKKSTSRGPVFRPTKDQIKEVQAMLKSKNRYAGEATGSYNDDTRTGIKSFQKENSLKETGTLNRATLEKMGVALTDSQKAIPVSDNSYASAADDAKPRSEKTSASAAAGDAKPKRKIFRATKDQVNEAQRMLKAKSMYAGEETGKLDDATREGLKKFQTANAIGVTGTLNQITLEKMGIALTDKQKEAAGNK